MDELLHRAVVRREQLRKELAALDVFIQSYAPLTEKIANASGNADLFDTLPRTPDLRAARAERVKAAIDAAERMIVKAGRPLSRSVLLRKLEAAGHPVEGGDKSKVLGTNLWRSKRFHNLTGAGYWPKSIPIPSEFRTRSRRPSMLSDEDI